MRKEYLIQLEDKGVNIPLKKIKEELDREYRKPNKTKNQKKEWDKIMAINTPRKIVTTI